MTFEVTSPTRVDLSGGTLDLWPLNCFLGGAITLNMPISITTWAKLEVTSNKSVYIESKDVGLSAAWASLEEFLADQNEELKFYQAIIGSVNPPWGFRLQTRSHSPVGGGLGGSSSLTVSILKTFLQALKEEMSPWQIVQWAHNVEARVLGKPTGTQDYVPAVQPKGINAIHYDLRETRMETLKLNLQEFSSRFTLVYTGRSHHSGINNWDVQKRLIDGDRKMLGTLKELSGIAFELYQRLKDPTPKFYDDEFPRLLRAETKARQALSPGFNSPEIESLGEIVLRAGGHAVKICGAGGGGCVMVWSPPDRKNEVEAACRSVRLAQVLQAEPLI